MTTMKPAVVHEAGGPEVLKIASLAIPKPKNGEVLIRAKAFGLNRSELLTRQGHSPNVRFPRVFGIEAVGEGHRIIFLCLAPITLVKAL